jgi:hypothetical protein
VEAPEDLFRIHAALDDLIATCFSNVSSARTALYTAPMPPAAMRCSTPVGADAMPLQVVMQQHVKGTEVVVSSTPSVASCEASSDSTSSRKAASPSHRRSSTAARSAAGTSTAA